MTNDISRPTDGFYRFRRVRRQVKNGSTQIGPWVPARIYLDPPVDPLTGEAMDRPPMLAAQVADEEPIHDAGTIQELWVRVAGQPVSAGIYRYMMEARAWALAYAPDAPEANDRSAVDLRRVAPILPPGVR